MKCIECGAAMKVTRETRRDTLSGLPNVILVKVEVRRCLSCGAEEVALPRVEGLHRSLADFIVRKPGRLAGAEVRFLRKYLGWSSGDFAKHMGVSREAVSRWENGHDKIGGLADRLLRLFVAHCAPIEDYGIDELQVADQGRDAPLKIRAKPARKGWALAPA